MQTFDLSVGLLLTLFLCPSLACDFNIQKQSSLNPDSEPTPLTCDSTPKRNLSWAPDGRRIAYSAEHIAVELVQVSFENQILNTYGLLGIRDQIGTNFKMALSPDGRRIVFRHENEGHLWVGDFQSTEVRLLTTEHRGAISPAWSPDGNWIAYTNSEIFHPTTLWMIPAIGGAAIQLTTESQNVSTPSWSPDGSRLAFSSQDSTGRGIYIMSIADKSFFKITPDSLECQAPDWSPDGSQIAYTSNNNLSIQTISVNDRSIETLVTESKFIENIAWSPDGTKLAYASQREVSILSVLDSQVIIADYRARYPLWHSDSNSFLKSLWARITNIEACTIADTSTLALTATSATKIDDYPVWASKDEIYFLRRSSNSSLYRTWYLNLETGSEQAIEEVPFLGVNQYCLDYNEKINSLAFDDGEGSIYLLNLDNNRVAKLIPNSNENLAAPSFSTNGDKIACVGQQGIIIFALDGDRLFTQERLNGQYTDVAWSSENTVFGSQLAVENAFNQLILFSTRNFAQNSFIPNATNAAWAANGTTLAFRNGNRIFSVETILTFSE